MRYLAVALFLLMSGTGWTQPLQLLTEDYPPFSYRRGNALAGISVDQMKTIMAAANIDYQMEMQPWARAFSLAESKPDTCVFTTGMLAERIPRFKWVQPLVLDIMMLVRQTGRPINPATIQDAKRFVIGVHKDDAAETYAIGRGFPRLDSAASLELSLKKLMSGRVDLVIMAQTTYETLRRQGQPVEAALNLEGTRAGLACNLEIPDATIAAMQAQLDMLISSGKQAAIYRQYDKTEK